MPKDNPAAYGKAMPKAMKPAKPKGVKPPVAGRQKNPFQFVVGMGMSKKSPLRG